MNIRKLLKLFALISIILPAHAIGPYLANGVRVGEVNQDSAIMWIRTTAAAQADFGMLPIFTEGLGENDKDKGAMPVDVLPGMPGEVQVQYMAFADEAPQVHATDWIPVDNNGDFVAQIPLSKLKAGATYNYHVRARPLGGGQATAGVSGQFQTAPDSSDDRPIRFIVTTCQAVRSIDAGAEGHHTYQQMLAFDPHFFVHTGDIVYYDKAPLAQTVAEARAKWNLMFAYGHNRNFHLNVTSYFMKDDHDTLVNDCWPGQTYGELSWEEGLAIFREQVPMGEKTYRTIRWGKDVQVWMTENRDFRSANTDPDGPRKTILGAEQKAWLKRTIEESDAKYKFVITPGPIVGPDKPGKNDNHSNEAFLHEGQELRDFIATQQNTYVITGDRHWQYCSVDPQTGVIELGCGPINDEHNYGGDPGFQLEWHRFFSERGGFLGITVENSKARAEWFGRDPDFAKSPVPILRHREILGAK
jgi:alkaline phosphatase D